MPTSSSWKFIIILEILENMIESLIMLNVVRSRISLRLHYTVIWEELVKMLSSYEAN